MSYSCPECTDGTLEAKVREVDLKLEDGEKAEIIGGVVLITSVGCDNGCSAEEAKPKTRKKRTAAAAHRGSGSADGETCPRSDLCSKANHHLGRCDTKLATREDK